jgi:uncharacterized ion transporter superfamily protein YfcC
MVVGGLRYDWGLLELSGLFVAVAIAAGIVGGLSADGTAIRFLEGAASIASGALVVGLARGVLGHFRRRPRDRHAPPRDGGAVSHLPAQVTILGIYAVQVVLSYVVPSGSGQAALSLPILAPLADLVGVTRQTTVLAYQFGDGFSNIFTPTSATSWPRSISPGSRGRSGRASWRRSSSCGSSRDSRCCSSRTRCDGVRCERRYRFGGDELENVPR